MKSQAQVIVTTHEHNHIENNQTTLPVKNTHHTTTQYLDKANTNQHTSSKQAQHNTTQKRILQHKQYHTI